MERNGGVENLRTHSRPRAGPHCLCRTQDGILKDGGAASELCSALAEMGSRAGMVRAFVLVTAFPTLIQSFASSGAANKCTSCLRRPLNSQRGRVLFAAAGMADDDDLREVDEESLLAAAAGSLDGLADGLAEMLAERRAEEHANIETDPQALLDAGHVWALLFNPGSNEEGIYSRRLGHTGQNLVLTFEEEDDAQRYASMLVATDFPSASTVQVESHSLVHFCKEGGHLLGLVRHGSLILPPEETVEEFDWSPGSKAALEQESLGMAPDELDESRRSLEALFGRSNVFDEDDGVAS